MKCKYSILLIFAVILYSCTTDKNIMVVGHRGAMGHETENTLAGVQKALDLGVDAIEIDVFKCKSGEIVVFHDEKVDRLTNGEGFIEDLTVFQLKLLTVAEEHPIPLLQDVLKLVDRKCKINIELKGKGTAHRVDFILKYYIEKKGWMPEDFIVSSFDEKELRNFYVLNKEIPLGVLTAEDPMDVLGTARDLNAASVHAYHEKLTEENIKAIQKEGFKVYAGVVNDAEDIEKMKAFGVDGIFTDFPERVNSN